MDFDAVILDPRGINQQELPDLKARFRRDEFSEFLALGRTIVVFTALFPLEKILPVARLGLKEISGSRIDFKGPDHLKAFYHAMQRDMQFLAYFETPPGRPFLFVSETSKPIATLVKHDRENILFLPSLRKPGGGYSDYPKQCERFMAAFQELNEHLAPKKPTIELPAWSSHYGWETERLLRNGLVSLQSHADEIATQINRKTAELELQDRLKVLFTGKGDVLVEIVIDVFSELGATADPGEPGRDDVVLEFEGKHAVIECADF